jgi:hypothetical protein
MDLRIFTPYLVIIMCLMGCPGEVKTEATDVSLRIAGVTERFSRSSRFTDGAVGLEFVNFGPKNVSILFSCAGGKGILSEEPAHPRFSALYLPTDFAILDYEWRNRVGIKRQSGSYELCGDQLRLDKREGKIITVPIKLPSVAGDYTLRIHFDNRHLERLLMSHNLLDLKRKSVFFEATSQISIKLNASK